ncbi:MAG: hypothetical protein ABI382_04375 [Nakamurella sp.]
MLGNLEVDTDEIRRARAALVDAADCHAQPATLPEVAAVSATLRHATCHGSAPVREALRLSIQRAEQGLEAAKRLATMTLSTADRLSSAAIAFDTVEQVCVGGN